MCDTLESLVSALSNVDPRFLFLCSQCALPHKGYEMAWQYGLNEQHERPILLAYMPVMPVGQPCQRHNSSCSTSRVHYATLLCIMLHSVLCYLLCLMCTVEPEPCVLPMHDLVADPSDLHCVSYLLPQPFVGSL